jgi:hypothetical protein
MKLKLADVRAIEKSLAKLMNKDLPIKIAYRLGKLSKIVSEESVNIENGRVNLVKKYSNGADKNGNFEVDKNRIEDFKREFSELLMEVVEFDFDPIPLSYLEEMSLTPIDIIRLDNLIYDDIEKIKE